MAFDYFAEQQVDIAIIETGLGGRLDSTNIISPILSIITNIGFDHTNLLGNTLEEIAFEKAGIIKKNTPVVIGQTSKETLPIFKEKAIEMNAPIFFAENLYETEKIGNDNNTLYCNSINKLTNQSEFQAIDLQGDYQLKNLATVLTAVNILRTLEFDISEQNKINALSSVKKITGLRGRWDIVSMNPTIIYDVAHNKDGIESLLTQLNRDHKNQQLHFVIGFVNDKDLSNIISLFPVQAKYYFTNAHNQRALPHYELKKIAAEQNLSGESYDNINDALKNAKINANENDVIIVCGSFFILSEIEPF